MHNNNSSRLVNKIFHAPSAMSSTLLCMHCS